MSCNQPEDLMAFKSDNFNQVDDLFIFYVCDHGRNPSRNS